MMNLLDASLLHKTLILPSKCETTSIKGSKFKRRWTRVYMGLFWLMEAEGGRNPILYILYMGPKGSKWKRSWIRVYMGLFWVMEARGGRKPIPIILYIGPKAWNRGFYAYCGAMSWSLSEFRTVVAWHHHAVVSHPPLHGGIFFIRFKSLNTRIIHEIRMLQIFWKLTFSLIK